MVVQIKQIEHIERVITLNTCNTPYETFEEYINQFMINDEEITPQSYFDIEYHLDNNHLTDTVNYYDGLTVDNKRYMEYVLHKIKTAYGDEG